jgi:hypothetical protein
MSRFDLFFVVVDECDEAVDTFIAKHIVGLHQGKPDALKGEYNIAQIQNYIRFARSIKLKVKIKIMIDFFLVCVFLCDFIQRSTDEKPVVLNLKLPKDAYCCCLFICEGKNTKRLWKFDTKI